MNILKKCYDSAALFYGQGRDIFWKNRFSWLQKIIKNSIEIAQLNVNENSTILDLGCGTGIASKEFLSIHPNIYRIIGIDLSSKMGEEAKNSLGNKFSFVEGDYTDDNIWGQLKDIQGVLAFFTLHWVPSLKYSKLIKNVYRKLNKGGWFLGASMGPNELGGIFNDLIRDLLQIYLPIDEVARILGQWNPKGAGEIEDICRKSGFTFSRVTTVQYHFAVQTYNRLTEMIIYQYNFWLQRLPLSSFPLVQDKLAKLLKNDGRFSVVNNEILVPHHVVIFEAHK